MFWTKAIPTERMNAEQLKRRFEIVETPDSAIFLASVMHILSSPLGFMASAEQRSSVLGDGRPIPMMSYGLVEYLLGLDLSAVELLELGGGVSRTHYLGEPDARSSHHGDPRRMVEVAQVAAHRERRSPAVVDRGHCDGHVAARPHIRCHRHRRRSPTAISWRRARSAFCVPAGSLSWITRTGIPTRRARCETPISSRSIFTTSGPCTITAARPRSSCTATFGRSPRDLGFRSRRSAARTWPTRTSGTAPPALRRRHSRVPNRWDS